MSRSRTLSDLGPHHAPRPGNLKKRILKTNLTLFLLKIFFFLTGTCLEQFTRGPCPDGQLVVQDEQGRLKCDCGPHMKSHYWIPDNLCYPHFEQGPCAPGEQFRAHPKEVGPACIVWGKTSQFDSKSALTG